MGWVNIPATSVPSAAESLSKPQPQAPCRNLTNRTLSRSSERQESRKGWFYLYSLPNRKYKNSASRQDSGSVWKEGAGTGESGRVSLGGWPDMFFFLTWIGYITACFVLVCGAVRFLSCELLSFSPRHRRQGINRKLVSPIPGVVPAPACRIRQRKRSSLGEQANQELFKFLSDYKITQAYCRELRM